MLVLTDAVVPQVAGQALPLVLRVVVPLPLLELLAGEVLVLLLPLRATHTRTQSKAAPHTHYRVPEEWWKTHRLLTLGAEALVAGGTRDLELVSVVDEAGGALRAESTAEERKHTHCFTLGIAG